MDIYQGHPALVGNPMTLSPLDHVVPFMQHEKQK
jgi:hypothetical protein